MATRLLNRRALRMPAAPADPPPDAATAAVPAKLKAAVKPRVRRKAVKAPPRLFARWAVCDNGMKHVAVFEYRDRAAADARLADLLDHKAGGYFLLLVKQPRPADEVPIA